MSTSLKQAIIFGVGLALGMALGNTALSKAKAALS